MFVLIAVTKTMLIMHYVPPLYKEEQALADRLSSYYICSDQNPSMKALSVTAVMPSYVTPGAGDPLVNTC